MKTTILLIFVVIFVALQTADAQDSRPRCVGAPERYDCMQRRDEGQCGRGCHQRAGDMWYFSRRDGRCRRMYFRGCGGSGNRFCSRRSCERRCARRENETGGGNGSGNGGGNGSGNGGGD